MVGRLFSVGRRGDIKPARDSSWKTQEIEWKSKTTLSRSKRDKMRDTHYCGELFLLEIMGNSRGCASVRGSFMLLRVTENQ